MKSDHALRWRYGLTFGVWDGVFTPLFERGVYHINTHMRGTGHHIRKQFAQSALPALRLHSAKAFEAVRVTANLLLLKQPAHSRAATPLELLYGYE
jgi:hypothetical protein